VPFRMVPGMSFTSVRERLVVVVVAPPLILNKNTRVIFSKDESANE